MPNKVVEALKRASRGLLYQSEKDEPFTVFSSRHKGELTAEELLQMRGQDPASPVEEVSLDEFFADLTRDEKWHDEEEKATAEGYRSLLAAIREHLEEAKVFRVGEKDVTVYIVGKTDKGNWAGLETTALET